MVGIPGKSKGCNTCRRRKIKCDEGRPACQKCLKSNRVCEGYEKYPVFINRSQNGIQRRQHLEEARQASPMQLPSSEQSVSLLRYIDSEAANMQAYTGYFVDSLLPSGSYKPTTWTSIESYRQAFMFANPSSLIKGITEALAETRFGKHADCEAIYRQGRRRYGNSLNLLQRAIQDPRQYQSDETLLAIRLMIAYESYEATTTDSRAWHNHITGLNTLLNARGAVRNASPIAQAVLNDMKHGLMIHAITIRRRCPLPPSMWQAVDSRGNIDHVTAVTSLGFEIAFLLEKGDKLAKEVRPSLHSIQQYLHLLLAMQKRLENILKLLLHRQNWHTRCEVCGIDPVDMSSNWEDHAIPNLNTQMSPCDFFLHLSITYALMIVIAASMRGVCLKLQHRVLLEGEQDKQAQFYGNPSRQVALGGRILKVSEHLLHHELGYIFCRSAMFPLQCARWAVIGDTELEAKCRELIEVLSGQRHIPFAKQVNIGHEHVSYFARLHIKGPPIVSQLDQDIGSRVC